MGKYFRKWVVFYLFCLAFLSGWLESGEEKQKILDMTYPYDEASIYWPTATPFRLMRVAWGMTEAGTWYASNPVILWPIGSSARLTSWPSRTLPTWTSSRLQEQRFMSSRCSSKMGQEHRPAFLPSSIDFIFVLLLGTSKKKAI